MFSAVGENTKVTQIITGAGDGHAVPVAVDLVDGILATERVGASVKG